MVILYCIFLVGKSQGFVDESVLRMTVSGENTITRRLNNEFRFLKTSSFLCSGKLLGFVLGAELIPSAVSREDTVFPRVEIWRSQAERDEEEIENSNLYKRISTIDINIQPGDFQPNCLLNFTITTPSTMSYQRGDILAIYQPSIEKSRLVIHYTTNISRTTVQSRIETSQAHTQLYLYSSMEVTGQYILIHPITGIA